MTRVVREVRYGIAVSATGQLLPWRERQGQGAVTLPRVAYSGLHLIAYGLRPRSLGRWALALDVLTDLRGGRRPENWLVEAFLAEVLPALVDAGESGIRAREMRVWLAVQELAVEEGCRPS